ncbi:MAG: DMT family transporter [Cycloclasticus sp.]|nr:DMT family transporter [Cycloclasticus sp.]
MDVLNNTFFYAMLMLIAGIGIPIMGALSGGLGRRLQSPGFAVTILFIVGSVISLIYLFFVEGLPETFPVEHIPIQYYLGGVFIVLYMFSITWVGPKFGIGNAICFVLLGQLISMTVIDHLGLMGSLLYPVSMQRIIGLVLMSAGVFLVVKRFE